MTRVLCFAFPRIALSGTDIMDQKNFMEKLLGYRSEMRNALDVWCDEDKKQRQEQERVLQKLQATVEAQGKILKAMAERLNITD